MYWWMLKSLSEIKRGLDLYSLPTYLVQIFLRLLFQFLTANVTSPVTELEELCRRSLPSFHKYWSLINTLHPKLHLHLMSPALAGRFPKNPDCYSCSQELDYSPPGWSWGPLYWWQVEHSRPWHKAAVQLFTGNELKRCTSKRKCTNKRVLCVYSLRSMQEVVALIWIYGYQEGRVEESDS